MLEMYLHVHVDELQGLDIKDVKKGGEEDDEEENKKPTLVEGYV